MEIHNLSHHFHHLSSHHLSRQIDATDAEINRLVYELYQLTDEEIAIVEGEKH